MMVFGLILATGVHLLPTTHLTLLYLFIVAVNDKISGNRIQLKQNVKVIILRQYIDVKFSAIKRNI